ncbi:MAG: phosphatase [Syntrophotaleaceae bacterium]
MPLPVAAETDLHVHTVASGHAYSPASTRLPPGAACANCAWSVDRSRPRLPGGPHLYHFKALRFIPRQIQGVRILRGVEANILGDGRLDLEDAQLEQLELVLAGFHPACGYCGHTRADHTRAVMSIMNKPQVKVICHPGNPEFPLDYQAIARHAAATGTALEINNSSFAISRAGSADNCRRLARYCAEYGAPVSLGSDAHIAQGVGELDRALAEARAAGIQPEQIVNLSLDSTLAFLGLSE